MTFLQGSPFSPMVPIHQAWPPLWTVVQTGAWPSGSWVTGSSVLGETPLCAWPEDSGQCPGPVEVWSGHLLEETDACGLGNQGGFLEEEGFSWTLWTERGSWRGALFSHFSPPKRALLRGCVSKALKSSFERTLQGQREASGRVTCRDGLPPSSTEPSEGLHRGRGREMAHPEIST